MIGLYMAPPEGAHDLIEPPAHHPDGVWTVAAPEGLRSMPAASRKTPPSAIVYCRVATALARTIRSNEHASNHELQRATSDNVTIDAFAARST
jgi:hypothetical protein